MKHVTPPLISKHSGHALETSSIADGQVLAVMVVDDDPVMLRLYAMQMKEWSINVETHPYPSAYQALMAMERVHPDLLIMDLDMPEIDGFELLKIIQENPRLADLVVIVATGLHPDEVTRRGGLPAYIPVLQKPISMEHIEQMARGVLIAKSQQE